jgi:hypothetical protein
MYSRAKWTSHKGEKILYADFSGISDEQIIEAANETLDLLDSAIQQGDRYTLLLLNVSSLNFQEQLPDEIANLANLRQQTTILTAIIGIEGLPKKLVNLLLPDIELVDTITEGKEWLYEQALGL